MAASTESMENAATSLEVVLESLQKGIVSDTQVEMMRNLTILFREQPFRESADGSFFHHLLQILCQATKVIQPHYITEKCFTPTDEFLQVTTECFRCQRNACVECPKNQNSMRDLGFIEVTIRILDKLQKLPTVLSHKLEALRCGMQFLGNAAAGNRECKEDIWKLTFPDFFVILIITQFFLKSFDLVERLYGKLNYQERLRLLELVYSEVEDSASCMKESVVSEKLAMFLADHFQHSCKSILKLEDETAEVDEECHIIIKLLNILCEMTSDIKKFMFLQQYPEILKITVELLREVHLSGKTKKNIFSGTHDFAQIRTVSHPAVGFKAYLIRLIGNLCYKNPENQNKVRELDGIPLILDNCCIDGNNPFINQWAIFTIRNVLEDSQENQEIIRQMKSQGVADPSTLRDLGFCVEERDGRLLLKPVKKGK
ncbi:ataxin-10 isoform X4 [Polypterus senegalus]|uniref:ataxin-10 isoform X4 n=1 Tax=Polypterus senegalus TaxID=55291 RepID=UPI00196311D9|nr:ataxin-10 isoform X4 [Polypterus senegalus]